VMGPRARVTSALNAPPSAMIPVGFATASSERAGKAILQRPNEDHAERRQRPDRQQASRNQRQPPSEPGKRRRQQECADERRREEQRRGLQQKPCDFRRAKYIIILLPMADHDAPGPAGAGHRRSGSPSVLAERSPIDQAADGKTSSRAPRR
jgi:hypothetical protein